MTELRVIPGGNESREPSWAVQRSGDKVILWIAGVARVRLGAGNARRLAAALLVASERD